MSRGEIMEVGERGRRGKEREASDGKLKRMSIIKKPYIKNQNMLIYQVFKNMLFYFKIILRKCHLVHFKTPNARLVGATPIKEEPV